MGAISQWGLYNWFDEHGQHLIHPEDIDAFRTIRPQARVFRRVCEDGGYLTIQFGERRFRVKPELFRPVPPPRYQIGDRVSVGSHPANEVATVCDVFWHFKDERPYYLVQMNGKPSGKRYWEEELSASNR